MSDHRPRVVYCTATHSIIDVVRQGAGETDAAAIQRLAPQYGTALTALPAAEAQDRYERQFITPIVEITEQDYDDALNVLPPYAWTHARGGASFKIPERIAGRITAIYVALQGRHFRFHDDIRTPHEECLKRAAHFITTAQNGGRHERNPV